MLLFCNFFLFHNYCITFTPRVIFIHVNVFQTHGPISNSFMYLLVRPLKHFLFDCTLIQLAPFWKEITFFSKFKSQEWTKSIFFFYYHNQEMKSWWKCVVLENIHSPPTEGIGNSWVVGGSQRPKNLIPSVGEVWIIFGTTQLTLWSLTVIENSSILKQILYMKINLENFYSWTSFKWPVLGYGESGRKMEVGCSKEVGYKLV